MALMPACTVETPDEGATVDEKLCPSTLTVRVRLLPVVGEARPVKSTVRSRSASSVWLWR